jgi:hypothetical protein
MPHDIDYVLAKLDWMRRERIWPNGLRYLWTDAFGVVLLLSLRDELADDQFLNEAEWVVGEVDRVLGRPRGIRIGEEPDRDGQYYHYLAMWLFALWRLGQLRPKYHDWAIELARTIHPRFVIPGVGVQWKMLEDLSGPYLPYGLGALDPFHGLVVYRLLDADALSGEIALDDPLPCAQGNRADMTAIARAIRYIVRKRLSGANILPITWAAGTVGDTDA